MRIGNYLSFALLVLSLLVGCGKRSTGPSAASTASTPSLSATRASAAVTREPATQASVSTLASAAQHDVDTTNACDEFPVTDAAAASSKREFGLARRLMAKQNYPEAIGHYTKALSTGVDNATYLGERGYARLMTNDIDGARGDLWQAAGACGETTVLAQIWYNLGLVFERQHDTEMSRVAWARSVALGSSKQAREKLGPGSLCPSSIKRAEQLPEHSNVANVVGWLGVHKQFNLDGAPKSEVEAKRTVCNTVSRAMGGPPDTDIGVCGDAPPWWISCCSGFGAFMARTMAIIPLREGRFFTIDVGYCGGWPRGCQGHLEPKIEVRGVLAIVTDEDSYLAPNQDFDERYMPKVEEPSTVDPPCRRGPPTRTISIYNMLTAKPLLEVQSLSSRPVNVEVNDALTLVKISGVNCDATVPLPKLQ